MIPATTVVVLCAAILTALGDVQRPTQGHQLGHPLIGYDVVFPLTVTQCDPVLIYYNISVVDVAHLYLYNASNTFYFFTLFLPRGVGYFDWICNIPTGYSFSAYFDFFQYYTVQPGSSNACLGDINTTYSYVYYETPYFQSYTQQSPSGNPSKSTSYQQPTIAFPTGPFSTITVNPNLAVSSTTTRSAVSSAASPSRPTPSTVSSTSSSSRTSIPASHHKSNKAVIAGGVIGGVILLLLIVTITFVFRRDRRNRYTDAALDPFTAESEPKPHSGLTKSQPGPTYFSTPHLPSSDQERNLTHGNSIDAAQRGSETLHNITQTAHDYRDPRVPMSRPSDAAGNASSSAPIAPLVPPKLEDIVHPPDQSTDEPLRNLGTGSASALEVFTRPTASQQQALIASLNAADPVVPEAQPPPVLADSQFPMALPQLSINESTNDDTPDIATILGVISRARLSPRERYALVASLNALLVPGRATPVDLTRVNAASPPPPYQDNDL